MSGDMGCACLLTAPHSICIQEGLLKRASELFCAPTVAELKRPDQGGWRGLFDVPFGRCSERNEFRSQAEAKRTADQNGSDL